MAPIRRYLRITQYSVLEVRIYLDNPADAHRWLLKTGDPALPRIIEAVRPLVLPKLREENERARKGGKKKGVKDVVVRDDFEVSIFLTELSTSHAILSKHKTFVDKDETNDDGAGSMHRPVDVDEPVVRTEEDDDIVEMSKIPVAQLAEDMDDAEVGNSGSESEESIGFQTQRTPKKAKQAEKPKQPIVKEQDEKKKLGFRTTYDGFRIHGRILCLVVKRKGIVKGKVLEGGAGQAMMEEWISSTQAAEGQMMDD